MNGDELPERRVDEKRAKAAMARFRPRNTLFTRLITRLVVGTSCWVMSRRNRLCLEGQERFTAVSTHAARSGRGLLTFSNHVSLLDDPFLVSNFGLRGFDYDDVRWVAADATNFFGGWLRGVIFSAGKCIPVVRGWGEGQVGFAFMRERLLAGHWVHLFPEGGRTRDPAARLRLPFKSGIGRLLDEARPFALAFSHRGMERVLPIGARWPRKNQQVRLRFGEAHAVDDDFLAKHAPQTEPRARWDALTRWTEGELGALERALYDDT